MNSLEANGEEDSGVPLQIGALTRAPQSPALLNACKPTETWKGLMKVEVPVDSCAAACVCGPEDFPATEIEVDETEAEYGCEYSTADGGIIHNVGKKLVNALTDDGDPMRVKWQVTQVKDPFLPFRGWWMRATKSTSTSAEARLRTRRLVRPPRCTGREGSLW